MQGNDYEYHYRLVPALAKELKVQSFLELGCDQGTLTRLVVYAGVRLVVGVDRNTKPRIQGAQIFQMTIEDFFAGPVNCFPPFDMVFIDADHDGEAVIRHFQLAFPHVSDQGLILLHDTFPVDRDHTRADVCSTAWKFAERLGTGDLSDANDIESCTLPLSPGITIVRKRKHHLAWQH